MNHLAPLLARAPALITSAGQPAQTRFLGFFAAQIRNPNTRRLIHLAAWSDIIAGVA